jgi:GNAT superfamily N-acetyltransferase
MIVLTDNQAPPFPPVRQLAPADLGRCIALAADRGWSPERAKWSLLLTASEVFGVDAPDGHGLAGSVTLTSWGPDLAAVGMMLVAARYSRRGLGAALMRHLLRAAGEDTTVTLFATDMGRPLYEKLGFAPVRRNVSFMGKFRPESGRAAKRAASAVRSAAGGAAGSAAGAAGGPARSTAGAGSVRPAAEGDLPAIRAVDRAAFGADRGRILTRLPSFAEQIAVFEAGQGLAGYAAAWRNGPASTVIGPLVAPDGEAARQLVTELAVRARTPVRLDLDPDRTELPGWAQARGLEPVARTVVMAHGPAAPLGTPERLFTPISVALA